MKFIVSKELFEKVPNAFFGVLVVKGFDNHKNYDYINNLLKESNALASQKYNGLKIKEMDSIIPYREAFQNLGINPNKFMCSIEALLTRISKGHEIPSINPLVDLGNAMSIKYGLPMGVHDIDKFSTDLEIRCANENDEFIPFGSSEIEKPEIGEMIYVSGNDVKTRRWTWRQGENSKITEESTNIFIPIDGFTNVNKDEVINILNELKDIFENEFNLSVQIGTVDKENMEFTW